MGAPDEPATKNPGALGDATGAWIDLAGELEQVTPYTILRSIFNDEGHFVCLERADG